MPRETERQYYFYWSGPFSQWHPSLFKLDDMEFLCAEQHMMFRKARLFGDNSCADRILAAREPDKQKALGRSVSGFDERVWIENRETIVFEGNYAKFDQNKGLRRKLFQTGDSLLVEASPVDTIWGIGLDADQAKATSPSEWPGSNLLGKTLTQVKMELESKYPEEASAAEISDKLWSYGQPVSSL